VNAWLTVGQLREALTRLGTADVPDDALVVTDDGGGSLDVRVGVEVVEAVRLRDATVLVPCNGSVDVPAGSRVVKVLVIR
jgi:hypothetical protein